MFEKINLGGHVWFIRLRSKTRRHSDMFLVTKKQLRASHKKIWTNCQGKRNGNFLCGQRSTSFTCCDETPKLGQVWSCLHSPSQKTWFSQRVSSEAAILLVHSIFFFFSPSHCLSLCGATEAVNTWKWTQSRQLINIAKNENGVGD